MTDTAHIAANRIPNTLKTAEDLAQWREFARRDDCLDRMVPSDLRVILSNFAFHPFPQWQPISTAPKDGTKVFIFRDGWDVACIANWGEHNIDAKDENGQDIYFSGWVFDNDCLFGGGHEDGFLGWNDDPMPTHWMPLPAPPAATEKGLV